MTGIYFGPSGRRNSGLGPARHDGSPVPHANPGIHGIPGVARDLGALCVPAAQGYVAVFDETSGPWRMGLLFLLEAIARLVLEPTGVDAAVTAGPAGAGLDPAGMVTAGPAGAMQDHASPASREWLVFIDSGSVGKDDLVARMGARAGSLDRLGLAGTVLATRAAADSLAGVLRDPSPCPADLSLAACGPLAGYAAESFIEGLPTARPAKGLDLLAAEVGLALRSDPVPDILVIQNAGGYGSILAEDWIGRDFTARGAGVARFGVTGRERSTLIAAVRGIAGSDGAAGETKPGGVPGRDGAGAEWPDASRLASLAARSPFRREFPYETRVHVRHALRGALLASAEAHRSMGLPPIALVRDADLMPAESLDLITDAAASCGADAPLILATCRRVPRFSGAPVLRILRAPGPSFFDTIQALREAASGSSIVLPGVTPAECARLVAQDADRLKYVLAAGALAARRTVAAAPEPAPPAAGPIAASRRAEMAPASSPAAPTLAVAEPAPTPDAATAGLAGRLLSLLPREFAEYLLVREFEDESPGMDPGGLRAETGFGGSLGKLLESRLARLGLLVDAGGDPVPHPALAGLPLDAFIPGHGAHILRARTAWTGRCASQGIAEASMSLYRNVPDGGKAPGSRNPRYFLECVSGELETGPSESPPAPRRPHPMESWLEFMRSNRAGDSDASSDALDAMREPGSGGAAGAMAALAGAFHEYSRHRPIAAIAHARTALLALGGEDLPREEARAQRVLGLCSLAQGQLAQGSAYFVNAWDLAASIPDNRECARAALSEAGCAIAWGDYGRAAFLAAAAREQAARAPDAGLVCRAIFASGRIALDLGRAEEAARHFGVSAAFAAEFGDADAAVRARIWAARASGLVPGNSARAADFPDWPGDPEALWFAALAAYGSGDRAGAAVLAARAAAALPALDAAYFPPDGTDRTDGYTRLEGLYAGYAGPRSLLRDRILVFEAFAGAMAGVRDPAESAAFILSCAREDRIAQIHPAAHSYFFCHYLMASEGLLPGTDIPSAISRAFKALQVRARRLDDSTMLDDFFGRNAENSAIFAHAHRYRLY